MNSRTAVQRKATGIVYEKPLKIIRDELSSIENSQIRYKCSSEINVQRVKKHSFEPL